ncbi:MAG TPA: PDZ domain-containing protein [Terriglobia bacterium]|nr:PDZ domain-containing protein [Terriglobia bacterium]
MKGLLAVIAAVVTSVPALAQDSGWIGVSVTEQQDRGVLVRSVESNSPAERAGIRANDVIVQFNKQEVVGVLQLTRLVSETPVGRTVDVVIRRDKVEQTLKVTAEKSVFGPIHFQPQDFVAFRDGNVDVFRNQIRDHVQPFTVFNTTSVTQAGIRVDSLTPQLRDFFGVKGGEGVLISSVDANSAGSRAGLLAGDVVTAVDGRSIFTVQDFNREVRSRSGPFTLKLVRGKVEREVKLEK